MKKRKQKGVRYSENSAQATLWQFKMVIDNDTDVRYLLILDDYESFPECNMDLLGKAWYKIYSEFSEIVGGNRADLWLVKQIRLMAMKHQHNTDASILRVVQQFPHPEVIAMAKESGYVIDLKDFNKTFEKAYTQLKRMENTIKSLDKEQEEEPVKQDFDKLITTLEKFQGYGFDEHKMKVKKFANIYKKYKDAG